VSVDVEVVPPAGVGCLDSVSDGGGLDVVAADTGGVLVGSEERVGEGQVELPVVGRTAEDGRVGQVREGGSEE
jgi:hypothetical protein